MNLINDPNESRYERRMNRRNHSDSRVLLGIIFVAVGALLIAENLNILSYDLSHILISWPMLLIALGVYNLSRKAGSAGFILIGIGTYFLLPRIFEGWDDYNHYFWPLILVFIGLVFIFQWKRNPAPQSMNGSDVDKNDILDETSVFGGRNMSLVSEQFRGGKVTAIFGGSKINLMYCKPVDGCVIDVVTIFGGTKIIVPEDWNVKTEVVSIFGGFEDKRSISVISRVNQSKVVVIKGSAIFGGGEITSMP